MSLKDKNFSRKIEKIKISGYLGNSIEWMNKMTERLNAQGDRQYSEEDLYFGKISQIVIKAFGN